MYGNRAICFTYQIVLTYLNYISKHNQKNQLYVFKSQAFELQTLEHNNTKKMHGKSHNIQNTLQ